MAEMKEVCRGFFHEGGELLLELGSLMMTYDMSRWAFESMFWQISKGDRLTYLHLHIGTYLGANHTSS